MNSHHWFRLKTLFQEMKEKINVTTYTTYEEKIEDVESGRLYSNTTSWKEEQRICSIKAQTELDTDTKPSYEQLRRMARAEFRE